MTNCYFCYRPLGGHYDTVTLRWTVTQMDLLIDGSPSVAVVQEKAHRGCLKRAQDLFEDSEKLARYLAAGGPA